MQAVEDQIIKGASLDDREIKDWRALNNKVLLYSKYDTERELRNDWDTFNRMLIQYRRESDWKSIDIFGFTNYDRYQEMLSDFLKNDIEDDLYDNQYIPMRESANDTTAVKWNEKNPRKIITKADSLKDLEDQWAQFNSIPAEHRSEVDTASIEIFGMSNYDHYLCQRREFLKDDIDTKLGIEFIPTREEALRLYASKIDNIGAAETCMRIQESSNVLSNIILEKAEKDIADKIDMDNMMALSITPFYSPYEMEKLGISTLGTGIYSDEPDNILIGDITTKQWFQEYKNKFNGFNDDSYISQSIWIETMRKLYSGYGELKESGDASAINNRKQSILDLGWNPEIPFNENNRIYADNRINTIIREQYSHYRIIDVENSISLLSEESNSDHVGALRQIAVRPIYIVFSNSNTVFNKLVRAVDKTVYSHVAIAFNASLKTMYGFNAHDGGFHTEHLSDYIKDVKSIQVFTIFVDADRYDKLKNRITYHQHNKGKHKYSFINLITIPLKINYIDKTKMVCSQFVDSMLKLADLNITGSASQLISPGILNRSLKKYKGDIYKIYTGSPAKYSANKVSEFMNKLATSIVKTESNVLAPFLGISSIKEAKEFPVQFTDDGDLLISKGKDIDFEGEYSRIHIALVEYDKANNTEAMKYCLCKLWYMNIVLEERIHEDKADKVKVKEYHKARAKILNDVKTYMKKVQKSDKNFDMLKEYNESPFNSETIKIRRSTLLYTIDLFKRIIGVK